MLNTTAEEILRLEGEGIPLPIKGLHSHLHRTLDIEADPRKTQATFFKGIALVPVDQFHLRIDERHLAIRLLLGTHDIDHKDTGVPPRLRSGQANPLMLVHQLKHAIDAGLNPIVHHLHRSAPLAQDRIGIDSQTQIFWRGPQMPLTGPRIPLRGIGRFSAGS